MRLTLFKKTILASLLMSFFSMASVQADPASVVQQLANKSVRQLSDSSVSKSIRFERARKLLKSTFHAPLAAQIVLGQYWKSANKEQKIRFTRNFQDVVAIRFVNIFDDYKVGDRLSVLKVIEDSRSNKYFTVKSILVRSTGRKTPISWRVYKSSKGDRVVNATVDGVGDLGITLRSEYASVIRRKGLNGLMVDMRKSVEKSLR